MTLLEGMVALAILGVAGTGFLEVFHASARAARDRGALVRALACAEAGMEAAKAGGAAALAGASGPGGAADACDRTIESRPWQGAIVEIVVTARAEDGRVVTLRRLTRAPGR